MRVEISSSVSGFLDTSNLTDGSLQQSAVFLKTKLKEGMKIRVRVLSVDVESKSLKLTKKPLLMQQIGGIEEEVEENEENENYHILQDYQHVEEN